MKTIQELNEHNYPTTPLMDKNLKMLFERLMEFQDACGVDFVITSGLRSEEKQLELRTAGKTNSIHSKHCAGLAADILDQDGSLAEWVSNELKLMETIGLWFEDFKFTRGPTGWVHAQCTPPGSGKRVFIP